MDIHLMLTAQPLRLAGKITRSNPAGGIIYLKNVPECTYLAVTPKQAQLLEQFRNSRTVPAVLGQIIEERLCPPLGEFYELIVKAVQARILVPELHDPRPATAVNWSVSIKPLPVRPYLWVLLVAGLGLTMAVRPVVTFAPGSWLAGLLLTWIAAVLGSALAASLLRGGGGEVYATRRWILHTTDACMLTPPEQQGVLIAPLAVMSAVTAIVGWSRPGWMLFPLVALLFMLRPVLASRSGRLIRAHANRRLSDAEHHFAFHPNRTPGRRWRMLLAGLRNSATWTEIGYGILWTLILGYFVGMLTPTPPWTAVFWQTQGLRLVIGVAGSLLLLGAGYVGWEAYLFTRERALARHETFTQWKTRWLGRNRLPTDGPARERAILRSQLLRQLPPPDRNSLIWGMRAQAVGPWSCLHDFGEPIPRVSLILSGKVGVYRKLRSGRRALIQTLREDDLVGLHADADPQHPEFMYRTLTPVVLLQFDRSLAGDLILPRFDPDTLANFVLKLPFLHRLTLCQNWHQQAVQRFAQLSTIVDYQDDDVILAEGAYNNNFYVMYEGEAKVSRRGQLQARLHGGDFFGEIGLLQNSSTRAEVTAGEGARCLRIPRQDFLRFVTHNYTVALELERVSSKRLGRPIFPLTPGNFQEI